MRLQPALLWSTSGAIGRAAYLLAGAFFFLVKFSLDWTVATVGFGRSWSPFNYLIWPNDRVLRVFELGDPERAFSLTPLLLSLPFIWIGVILTLHRLRSAGLPLVLIALFFVPLVNLLLFLVLVLLPTRETIHVNLGVDYGAGWLEPATRADMKYTTNITAEEPVPVVQPMRPDLDAAPPRLRRLRQAHRSIVRESHWRSGLVALAVAVPLAVLGVVLGAQVLQSYGFSLFVGAPFALGMISVLLFGFSRRQSLPACLAVAFAAATLAGLVIVVVALEGVICLIMAAPIAYMLAFFGALVGYAIQARPWLSEQALGVTLAVVLVLPTLMAAEAVNEPAPEVRAVASEVHVAVPPAQVWPHVIAFPPLAEPDDWYFRTGVAYPQRAEIIGTGVGAERHCVFSTGTFVEPIDVWDEPSCLAFRVTAQPEPMHEWSPYAIHPPHLDHYLVGLRGEFRLEALPDDGTRLVGTTWYTNRMWPAAYWNAWSDYIIHRIHGRVLAHVQRLAETPAGRAP